MTYTIGFTGTKEGLTDKQMLTLRDVIDEFPETHQVVHGDCVGADESFAHMAMAHGLYVITRPGCDAQGRSPFRANASFDKEYTPEPYLIRNTKIVGDCNELIACPKEMVEELRSGTWSTVRRARKQQKKITIIYPDGTVSAE